ncbi:MAG: hypothetical protein K0S09_152 [Sphingobacteriaceae bacterium]|jgi:membrane protein YqaA with SNARE-associated domain|nr:hypothetical protein [Sphingobacteriaceae bacterium]
MFYKILTVIVLSSFEIYAAIPAGYAMGLTPFTILCSSIVGGLAGVFIAAYLGDRIKAMIKRYKKNKGQEERPKKEKTGLAHRIWVRYGIIGLGFFGTITVGAPASIAVGIGLNAPVQKLVTWCCIGIVVRCVIFTFMGHLGSKLF